MRATPDFNAIYPFTTVPAAGWGKDNTTNEWVISHVPSSQHVEVAEDGKDYTLVADISKATRYPDASAATIAAVKLKAAVDVAVTN